MSAGLQLKCPSALSLDGNIAKNWKDFIRAYDLFALASEIDAKDEKVTVCDFPTRGGTTSTGNLCYFHLPRSRERQELNL